MTHTNQIYKRKLVMQKKKIPDTSRLVKKTDNSKITESFSGLANSFVLTGIENKMPDFSS